MASKIQHKRSSVQGKVPTDVQLDVGELAVNTTDIALYTKTTGGTVVALNDWSNILNKPDLSGDTIFYGDTEPDETQYSFWYDTSNGDFYTAVDNGVDAIFWELVARAPGREMLDANRTYYVATTGSDSNDGLAVETPFLTIQKAVDSVCALDCGIYNATIQLADGTYGENVSLRGVLGSGTYTIQGNSGTPANVINSAAGTCFTTTATGYWTVKDLKVTSSGANGLATSGGELRFTNLVFGTCATNHMVSYGGRIITAVGYTIDGNAGTYHMLSQGTVADITMSSGTPYTITLSGTRTFNTFAYATSGATITVYNATYTGTGTGKRYDAVLNSVVNTFGGGASKFPGNVAGTTATGGQYA